MILAIKILLGILLLSNSNEVIENYLKKHLSNFKKYEYEITKPGNKNIIPDESREFKLENNYAYVPVNYFMQNGETKQGIITLKMKLYQDVLVSTRNINKDEELNLGDFIIEEKEITSLRTEPILNFDNINKFRARINISSESVIGKNMVEVIPDVKIGDNVNAVYSKGIIHISFNAAARTEGKVGDVIKIRTEDKKIFKAVIINYNTVKIVE
ncbi:MAG: flagellar basal body P-ring formation protein FlgA [Ignavibacteriae bacterium]|nr:flagellar basal body P-ring formation protein FlgA [Ignavibacteriota bacterium]